MDGPYRDELARRLAAHDVLEAQIVALKEANVRDSARLATLRKAVAAKDRRNLGWGLAAGAGLAIALTLLAILGHLHEV